MHFSQPVNSLVYPGKWIEVSDGYGVEPSIFDTKLERNVLFRCKDDWGRPLGCGQFDDVLF